MAFFAKISIFGRLELIVFFGGYYIPLTLLLRNFIRLQLFPIEKYDPWTATCCDDTAYLKKWSVRVYFISAISGVLIFLFL
jgi:hypothetical protein